jgi:hypothetical protein
VPSATSSRRTLSTTANSNASQIATGRMNTRFSTASLRSTSTLCLNCQHGASPKPVHPSSHMLTSLIHKRSFVQINSALGDSTS